MAQDHLDDARNNLQRALATSRKSQSQTVCDVSVLRALVAYYSKTGNTQAISSAIKEALEPTCQVDLLRIKMVKEYSDNLLHVNPRVILDIVGNRKPRIVAPEDVDSYDLICIGTPNWYSRIAPPVNTFIDDLANATGKKAVAYVSSGFALESYATDLGKILENKGLRVIKRLSLKQEKISESQLKEIRETFAQAN